MQHSMHYVTYWFFIHCVQEITCLVWISHVTMDMFKKFIIFYVSISHLNWMTENEFPMENKGTVWYMWFNISKCYWTTQFWVTVQGCKVNIPQNMVPGWFSFFTYFGVFNLLSCLKDLIQDVTVAFSCKKQTFEWLLYTNTLPRFQTLSLSQTQLSHQSVTTSSMKLLYLENVKSNFKIKSLLLKEQPLRKLK